MKKIIEKATKELGFKPLEVLVERPKEREFGDYATNLAMMVARQTKKSPMEIARKIESEIKNYDSGAIEKVEVIEPGFINFFLSKEYLQKQVGKILKERACFPKFSKRKPGRVNIEFISANPTGPLTLGNGRGGFCGDVLANVLEKSGHKVTREYYINDKGAQIKKLGHSVIGDSEAVYKGVYIDELRKKLLKAGVSQYSPEGVGERAAKVVLREMIRPTVKKMGIKFDVWFSEKSLYRKKEVDKAIKELNKKGFTYESEGAVWFKSKELGDDKDRILIRSDGIKTYFASDIAYLINKFKRGFKQLIFFLGADHYGYVARLQAAALAFGYKAEQLKFIVMQMVRLFQDGKEIRMSKRSGVYVTLDELLDEVELDAARFFFLQRSSDTHLNFDMGLAKEKSEKNPVYYVQYAYARICSILRKAKNFGRRTSNFGRATSKIKKEEFDLIKQLIRFPEIIEDIAKDYQVQRLPIYALELVAAFHRFYENCRVISDDKELSRARLGLVLASQKILKNTLDLMGISAPEKM